MQSLDDAPIEEWGFEWDEDKRRSNIRKHGLDFEDAMLALSGPRLEHPSPKASEHRIVAVCPLTGKLIAVVYMMRGRVCRIISVRAAGTNERRKYHAHYST
jgi:uncharacterized DUF497 family protein